MVFARTALVSIMIFLLGVGPVRGGERDFASHRLGDAVYTAGMLGVYGFLHGLEPLDRAEWWQNTPTSRELKHDTVPVPALLASEILLTGLALFPLSQHAGSIERQQGAMLVLQSRATSSVFNTAGKWFFGRYRPDYQARLAQLNQAHEQLAANPGDVYWQERVRKWEEEVKDGRRSFWSGHATEVSTVLSALSFYTWHHSGLGKNERLAMTGGLSAGIGFVCSSRIVDNQHHLGDVLTGLAMGIVTSAVVYRYQYGNWPYQHTKDGWGLVLTYTSGMVSGWLFAKIFK